MPPPRHVAANAQRGEPFRPAGGALSPPSEDGRASAVLSAGQFPSAPDNDPPGGVNPPGRIQAASTTPPTSTFVDIASSAPEE